MDRYPTDNRSADYQEDQARQARSDRGEDRYVENVPHVPPPPTTSRPPDLYDVSAGAQIVKCRRCPARIAFVPGRNPQKMVPASIDSPFAVKADGRVVAAPSHFTDCPEASSFSKNRKP